ncbi:putative glucan endo-1,3-beta-D-glucosidase [Lupinus albus]|uniref:glucan endo-1,3-beta-D-glucosidase n=1 Tax=Lupinus albus TaxID=3870 RepID=A0A6A4RBJ1_LUPAL|nr:putative glucan endo-1,3-beta-D-glucosidase [Lupinus albus]
MCNIEHSLRIFEIHNIKIGTSSSMDVLETPFPPSKAAFRNDISDQVLKPMLEFLSKSESYFFLDVYSFFAWASDPISINLDYALFKSKYIRVIDPGTNIVYTNIFDQMIDAIYFSMNRLGYPNVLIFIAETGWPNSGDSNQIGAIFTMLRLIIGILLKKLRKNRHLGLRFYIVNCMMLFVYITIILIIFYTFFKQMCNYTHYIKRNVKGNTLQESKPIIWQTKLFFP